ncbi:phasin family protein [Pelagibius sp. 7325]|uniref:phasin family protein n=1 Tax=Pelagibius sp. 7325 TaxID=3131994 RepID=UPI0030EEA556
MATARTETASEKKATAAKTATKTKTEAASAPEASAGSLIAERYRDTAYETLVGKNGENVTAVMSAGEAMFAGMAEVSQEMMTFAGERLRQDIETAEDFAKATSPEELFEKQCSFAQRAAQQYAEETSKLIRMMARIQQSCWKPVEACTKAALHGMNGEGNDSGKK